MTRAGLFIIYGLKQVGKPYILGAEVGDPVDPDPPAFDCSELMEKAAEFAGVPLPDGACYQFDACREITVAEAKRTLGALLFIQNAGGYPDKPHHIGHVAMVIARGWCVEAKGRAYGVVVSPITSRFNRAGKLDALYQEA